MANTESGYEWLREKLDSSYTVLSVGETPDELREVVTDRYDLSDSLPPLGFQAAFTDLDTTGIQGAATAYLSTTTDGKLLATCNKIHDFMADNRFNQMWKVVSIYAIAGRIFVYLDKTNSYTV